MFTFHNLWEGRAKTHMTDPNHSEVGIFYVVNSELFRESTPLSLAEPYGDDFLIYPGGHAQFWEEVMRLNKALSGASYDYFPRGRVLFNVKQGRYWVYVDQCALRNPTTVAKILSKFRLPPEKTEVSLDSHYKCHACNPEYVSDAIGLEIDDYLT
jgi:hypothetical protein